ncbi:ACT domain-containing protein [Actinomadura sp. ATCC 31491]|uniref:ACT domain-containing protein n=1 Tax=Actinomadura luzonensis TaxID=2805427 RepID=A0ABT0FWR7_9ACTN|nr:ACT domain-containing protein [Actinomadura luzonensis]MCK2216390.1 ACT domain-containing protein [Actinomadura luzonensis]
MSDARKVITVRTGHLRSWRWELAELAVLFVAVGLAHLIATLLGHEEPGPIVLVGLGLALILGTAAHRRLGHRRATGRNGRNGRSGRSGRQAAAPDGGGAGGPMALWRIRMRVVERPGRLAAVAAAFGRLGCNILALHIAPTGSSAITPAGCDALDEFVIEAPRGLPLGVLAAALAGAGGHDVVIVPAQVKDLTDPGVQALVLAQRVAADPDRLPEALGELLRVTEVEWRRPGDTVDEGAELNTTMVVSVNPDRALLIRRPGLPFTPTEAARAAALTSAARQARYSDTP